jgi:HK97 family phage major capsid protein
MSEGIQQVVEQINNLGDTYLEKFSNLKTKYDGLEEEVKGLQRSAGTAKMFGGSSNPGGLREQISEALNENTSGLAGMFAGNVKSLHMETKAVGDMAITTNLTGGTSSISMPAIGPVGMAYRLNNVRDMLRQTGMTTMYLPLLKDAGGEGTPAPVAEGAVKPEMDFDLAETNAKAEVIAATTTISKQFLEDVQNARTWLTDRLVEAYNAAESDQLLNGNGTSPNLKGLNTSGNFTTASGLATIDVEQLIQGILQMRILKRRPSAIIINPASLESLLLNKASTSGEYDLPSYVSVSPVGQLMILGVPVIDISEQPAGTFTIHDNTGSLYAVRQGITIEFFDQTYATTNKILIRIESRIAFPNFGPSLHN